MLSGFNTNGNLVNFAGQVVGQDVFLNVKISDPDQKRAATMSLIEDMELEAEYTIYYDKKSCFRPN